MTTVSHTGAAQQAAPSQRALYVTRGSFSHINDQLQTALQLVMPQVSFERLDISDLLRQNYPALLRCLWGVQREYGFSSWTSKEKMRYRLIRSRAYFDVTRDIITRHIGDQHYDFIVQTQSLFNAKMPGVPTVVYTDHVARAGGEERKDTTGAPSDVWFENEQSIYGDVDHVFTFGPSVRQLLLDAYDIPAAECSAIGAGASVVPTRAVDTSLARYARRNIVFVGVEWERKGGPELVAAFKALRARMPEATLKIIGCAPELDDTDGIEILGRRPLSELEDHFHDASCFCMPSRLEPFGVVFVEAMQFALPVVSTDVSDIGAIVRQGETGLVTPPGDIAALSDALYDTLENAERCQAMGLKALERAKCFTWQAVARQIAEKLPVAPKADVPLLEPSW